jgi:outer membrane autotransporter protein
MTHGASFATSLEGGCYPVRVGGNLVIEPQAQLVYQHLALADASDAASDVFFHDADSLPGRLGAELRNARNPDWDFGAMAGLPRQRTNQVTNQVTTWFRADLWYEFVANPTVAFSSEVGPVPFSSDLRRTWADLRVGATVRLTTNVALFMNAGYDVSLLNHNFGYDGKAGFRIAW